VRHAVDLLDDHARPRHGHFVAFAAHVLEQHAEMQLAAAEHHELVRIGGRLDAQRHVVDGLAVQALADLPAGDELAFAPRNGEVLTSKVMLIVGSSTVRLGSGSTFSRIAQRVRHLGLGDAGEGDDVARARRLDLDPRQAVKSQDLRDPLGALLALAVDHGDGHALLERAALDAADADGADVARVIEQRDLQLQRTVASTSGGGQCSTMVLNSGCMSPSRTRRIEAREAAQRRGIDHREIQLLVGGAQAVEQIEGLIQHPARARLVAVDLVDDDDGAQAVLERLLGDEAGLRHRAVHGIDQQQHAVDHGEHALDLAAEIGVPGVSTMLMR
jgi:hypothetical protein